MTTKTVRFFAGRFYCRVLFLLNYKPFDGCKQILAIVSINCHIDRLEQIKAENTHYGFAVNHITSRRKVYIRGLGSHYVNKVANILDSLEFDFNFFHIDLSSFRAAQPHLFGI